MQHRFPAAASAVLLVAAVSVSAFGLNYNASKSNTGNVVVQPSSVTGAQAMAILAMIDKTMIDKKGGAPTQDSIQSYLKAAGVKPGTIKSIVIEPGQAGKTTVLLLDAPGDADKARSVANITTSRSNVPHN